MRVVSALLLVAAACGGDVKTTPALDPITLAPLVSQAIFSAHYGSTSNSAATNAELADPVAPPAK
jgi:hypothetical protein